MLKVKTKSKSNPISIKVKNLPNSIQIYLSFPKATSPKRKGKTKIMELGKLRNFLTDLVISENQCPLLLDIRLHYYEE